MENDIDKILSLLREFGHIDFKDYRREMLLRRVQSRVNANELNDFHEYADMLEKDPDEYNKLINTIAINVSSFFRDPYVFEIIVNRVLPEILELKKKQGSREIRIWSAGCAAGEEPYSIAMQVHDLLLQEEYADWNAYIFATDIDKKVIADALKAEYKKESLENVKLGDFERFFVQHHDKYKLSNDITNMVNFSYHDLSDKKSITPTVSIFGSFDLVLCRNVVIYFNRELQKKVFELIYRSIGKGGFLVLGESESLDNETAPKFITNDNHINIYEKL